LIAIDDTHHDDANAKHDIGQTCFDRLGVPLRVGFGIRRSSILSLSKDAYLASSGSASFLLWVIAIACVIGVLSKEVELIRCYRSNDPVIGYNLWPKFKA
jgi:hypothetical protein